MYGGVSHHSSGPCLREEVGIVLFPTEAGRLSGAGSREKGNQLTSKRSSPL